MDSVLAGLGEVLEQVKEVKLLLITFVMLTGITFLIMDFHSCFMLLLANSSAFISFLLHFLLNYLHIFMLPCFPCNLLSQLYLTHLHFFLLFFILLLTNCIVLYCILGSRSVCSDRSVSHQVAEES